MKKFAWCVLALVLAFPVAARDGRPGVDGLDLTLAANRAALRDAGPVVLWAADDWALVTAGSVPGAEALLAAGDGQALYLARAIGDGARQAVRSCPRWHEIEPGTFVVAAAPVALEALAGPGLQVARLGRPFAWRPEAAGLPIARDVEYKPYVQDWVDAVTTVQLVSDLTSLVNFVTRYSYSNGCVQAGQWLAGQYQALGLQVTTQNHTSGMAPNVIAEKPGSLVPEEIVIICGHYDSTSQSPTTNAPGADDNGTGSAATLMAARVLAAQEFERTIRFIGFSGEEQGLYGSEYYADMAAAAGEEIVGVYNFDMIGWVDIAPEDLECIGNNASAGLVDHFIECAQLYTALPTHRVIDGSIWPSDHSRFWNVGYQAFLGIEDYDVTYPYYHTTQDTVDKVNQPFFTEVTRAAVAAVAELAGPLLPEIYVTGNALDDSAGDGDGLADPSETVALVLEVRNNLDQASGPVEFTLSCSGGSSYVTIVDGTSAIADIPARTAADTGADPFVVFFQPGTPDFTAVTFEVAVSAGPPHMESYSFAVEVTSYAYEPAVLEWTMDANPNWTVAGGLWAWGVPTGQGGSSYGEPDPTSGHTGANVLGTNLAGDYTANCDAHVTSGYFDCSEVRQTELRLWRWLNVEQPSYDQATIWVDGGAGFVQVWENPSEMTDTAWNEMVIDISALADGQSQVRLRFRLEADSGWEYSGWNIDDVAIAGLVPGDPLPTPTPTAPLSPTPTPTASPAPPTATPAVPTATPAGSATPTPEPTGTPGEIGVDLVMNSGLFHPGDPFHLGASFWNATGTPRTLAMFVILDVLGEYWFWPDWSQAVDYQMRLLPSGTTVEDETILDFTWPSGAGALEGVRFWGAFTDETLAELVGSYDSVTWGFAAD